MCMCTWHMQRAASVGGATARSLQRIYTWPHAMHHTHWRLPGARGAAQAALSSAHSHAPPSTGALTVLLLSPGQTLYEGFLNAFPDGTCTARG